MLNYVGRFRVFQQILLDGTPSPNKYDNFLKTKANSEVFRYDKNVLAIFFTTSSSTNKYIPLLKKSGVDIKEYVRGETEATFLFPEDQIDLLAQIMKPQTKGKNIKPNSVKTSRRLQNELHKKNAK